MSTSNYFTSADQLPPQYRRLAAQNPIGAHVHVDDSDIDAGYNGTYEGHAVIIGYDINRYHTFLVITDQGAFYNHEVEILVPPTN